MTAPGGTLDDYAFDEDEAHGPAIVPAAAFSIGGYLAAQRRLRGMSLDELEASTRIPRRSLRRLEAGAFDRQQDAFARGFVRTVALAIGLDPGDTLVRMLTGAQARPDPSSRLPLRAVGLGLCAAVLLGLLVAAGAALIGHLGGREGEGASAPSEPLSVLRRDYVRELADLVGASPPGTFARPRPLAAPPLMFAAPAPEALALDAIFPRPSTETAAPAAVSSGVQ